MPSDLDLYRKAAKALKKALAARDPQAVERLRAVLPDADAPKHADILHVIAREAGHESWPKLKFAVETGQMSREARADRLRQALYNGQSWVVGRLLRDDPQLTTGRLDLQAAVYDLPAVRKAIESSPARATAPIGGRTPLLHLAFSKYIHMAPEKRGPMLEIADLLFAHGADPNDGFPPEPGSQHRLSALYGALGHANNIALAEWLLAHGASPDDNESLYHSTEHRDHAGLKLLIRYGARTRGTNAVARALDFNDAEAVRLLLEHGADPNEAVKDHPSGEPIDTIPALHQAARRWCSAEIARLLIGHGADPAAVWNGHSAYATALIFGNEAMARQLAELGHARPLSLNESILADCAAGTFAGARLDLASLHEQDRHLMTRIVWGPERLDHIKALIAAGLDPDHPDEMGLTPLHLAAWEGFADRVAYLITVSPDLTRRNAYGGDALSTTIHGSEFCPKADERDHIVCGQALLEAGAELRSDMIEHCGREDMALFLESWRQD
jgi:ankyrin repeat protein